MGWRGHVMKAFLLPTEILNKIDQKTKNFFWGHTEQNKAYLLSLFWKFLYSLENHWSKIITNKYGKDFRHRKYGCSYTSKNLHQNYALFLSCTKFIVGNGMKTKFWLDCWLRQPIRNLIQGPLPQNEDLRTLDSIIYSNQLGNHWLLENIPFQLPPKHCPWDKCLPLDLKSITLLKTKYPGHSPNLKLSLLSLLTLKFKASISPSSKFEVSVHPAPGLRSGNYLLILEKDFFFGKCVIKV